MRFFRPVPRLSLAGDADAADLAALLQAAWAPHRAELGEALWEELAAGAEEVEAWLKGGFEVYRATLDGRLVGTVRVAFPTGACVVDRLAVHPDHRRRDRAFARCDADRAARRWLAP